MSARVALLSAALPLAALLTLADAALAQDWDRGRPRQAVEMCVEHARDILRDRNNNRDVEVDDITRIDEDDDIVKVQGYLHTRDGRGDRRRAWLDCDVNFAGEDRIVYFDEEGFLTSGRGGDRDRDRDRDRNRDRDSNRGGGDLRADANQACRRLVRDQGYDVQRVEDRDRTDNGMRLEMRLRRNDRQWDAVCQYNRNRDEARLVRLEPQNR